MAEAAGALPWPGISGVIAGRLGLHFPADRHADLARGLAGAALELGFPDINAFASQLLARPLAREELRVLASHLTVGETYFFRERAMFDALAGHVIPDLVERRGRVRQLRTWSAACCTGEEPYSLSILLRQCIPDPRHWQASVLATDVNEHFLRKAADGVYGEWSFREAPGGFREAHFTRTADGRYAIRPQVRQGVSFATLNLVDDDFPSAASDTQAMDLILCRNVLMYFSPAGAAKVLGKLWRALRDDGWLVLGASEGGHALAAFSGFTPVNLGGVTVFRKADRVAGSNAMHRQLRHAAAPSTLEGTPAGAGREASGMTRGPGALAPPAATPDPSLLPRRARELANEGRLDDALAYCARWIAAQPLDAGARYLHAVIQKEAGRPEEAARSLRQAIFLQPDLVLAHFALGDIAREGGRRAEARRHFANALALLERLAADEPLPESDGLTAGRLKEVIASLSAGEAAS